MRQTWPKQRSRGWRWERGGGRGRRVHIGQGPLLSPIHEEVREGEDIPMLDIGGGEEEVHVKEVEIGREEHAEQEDAPKEHAKEEAGREEARVSALDLLADYHDDDEEEEDDQEHELHYRILEEMKDDGMERVRQDDTGLGDQDTKALHAQVASLEERMSLLMEK